ncbi:hypothetical protein M501DRAFT_1055683 [Patellaria atrata CBS 101060]|uniref:Ubiquitin interaction motif protein n=1 Tax=Patellaria atrata CBS 101060 TaxID=1346257 RepID=A0A9P4SFG1_9PEZI|nr:hypothetical protein M501DRAFT_1055683 [Patellaria atrata CBS 101060]
MASPSEEAILQFIEFTSSDRETALRFLKNLSDLSAAVEAYYINPDQYKNNTGYDESAFTQDRYGDIQSGIPAFQIDYANDSLTQYHVSSTAPTRPPSRASNRSVASGGLKRVDSGTDWEMGNNHSQQESGVIGSGHFGPATRSHYETSDWAMTIPRASSYEVIEDLPVHYRRRVTGEPVILKPLGTPDFLPNLLSILVHIPAARELLQRCGPGLKDDYGENSTWWTGSPIQNWDPIHLEDEPTYDPEFDLLVETQRLMAFLVHTDRSYGSAEALSNLRALTDVDMHNPKSLSDRFLIAWEIAVSTLSPEANFRHLFHSVAEQSTKDQSNNVDFWCVDCTLDNTPSGPTWSLYDAMDNHIWGIDMDGKAEDNIALKELADVLIIRLNQPDSSATKLNMNIPASWYVDRYLADNVTVTKDMRRQMAKCRDVINQIEEKQHKMQTYRHPETGKATDALLLLKTAMSAFQDVKYKPVNSENQLIEVDNTDSQQAALDAHNADVIKQLEYIYENVERKVEMLNLEKERVRATLDSISKILTKPSDDPSLMPEHIYTLRGVSTSPRITYLLTTTPDSTDNTSDNTGNTSDNAGNTVNIDTLVSNGDNIGNTVNADNTDETIVSQSKPTQPQWWKIEYITETHAALTKERTTESAVLDAAANTSRDVLLVYASTYATAPRSISLPEPLTRFIEKDNAHFADEEAAAPELLSVNDDEIWDTRETDDFDTAPWSFENDPENPPKYDEWGRALDEGVEMEERAGGTLIGGLGDLEGAAGKKARDADDDMLVELGSDAEDGGRRHIEFAVE